MILVRLVPEPPPVTPPDNVGGPHENNVPVGTFPCVPFTGESAKAIALNAVPVNVVMLAIGLTVTITVNELLIPQGVVGCMI